MQTIIKRIEIRNDPRSHSFDFSRAIAETEHGEHIQLAAETLIPGFSENLLQGQIDAFELTDGKVFRSYCRGEARGHDIFPFLDWVAENGYHFDPQRTEVSKRGTGVWQASGNLEEYSSAFTFYIFDDATVRKVRKVIKDNTA